MTTAPERSLTQDEQIDALSRYNFGWSDTDTAGADAKRGLSEAVVRDISAKKSEPEWMLEHRLKALSIFGKKPMPNWGFGPVRHRLRQHQVLRALDREAGGDLGRPARRHQEHLRQARHPRGREAAPGVRRGRAVRVRGRLPQDPRGPRGAGRHLPRHRHRAARAPGDVQGVLRLGDPGPATTSSPRSTPRCGRVARSSTCRRACTSRSRCRPTSGSTPRTWASSSAR